MEEKERYELQEVFEDGSFHWCLKDNDTKLLKSIISLHNCVDLLNQQDKRIKELEEETKVGEFWYSAYQGKQLEYDLVYAELRKSYDENQQLKQSQKQQVREEVVVELLEI